MKNRLISDKQREEYKNTHGADFPEVRHSGRTLGRALTYLGRAMENPGVEYRLKDHYHSSAFTNHSACAAEVESLIRALNIEFLTVTRKSSQFYLRCDIFKEEFYLRYDIFKEE